MIRLKIFKNSLINRTAEEVYISKNGVAFKQELKLISEGTKITTLKESSKELGVRCKKPFNISVLGLKRKVEKKETTKKKVAPKKKTTTKKKTAAKKKVGKK